MANHALTDNPPAGVRHITTHGSDWLWAVFAVMLLSMLLSVFWHSSSIANHRWFHQVPVIVLTVSSIAYFAMASDLGFTTVAAEFGAGHPTRQIWWVRYIQWFINAPLLLGSLLLLTGLTFSDIFTTVFFAWVLVITGLVGALTPSSYKWGFYAFGLFALFFIWWRLLGHSARFPFRAGAGARSGFYAAAAYLSIIWMLYPIAWGVSEGGNVISPDSEMVFYGILDLFAGPIFLALFGWVLRPVEYAGLGLGFGRHAGFNEKAGGGAVNGGYSGAPAGNAGVGANGVNGVNGTNGTAPAAASGAPAV